MSHHSPKAKNQKKKDLNESQDKQQAVVKVEETMKTSLQLSKSASTSSREHNNKISRKEVLKTHRKTDSFDNISTELKHSHHHPVAHHHFNTTTNVLQMSSPTKSFDGCGVISE